MTITYIKNRYGPMEYIWGLSMLLSNTLLPYLGKEMVSAANVIYYDSVTDCFVFNNVDRTTLVLRAIHKE